MLLLGFTNPQLVSNQHQLKNYNWSFQIMVYLAKDHIS